ncbi:clan AA aspartic protease, AF_0612 family [Rivularia sp. PCC 7116]|uniref:clan AA aspartic protease n=1 Tax=Rivularia sp. PCC 7116 TaxID=373994 RepID=UPI00029ECC78|nr:clan AA aspartic protease [Rivularia sp. PCC 7116]AFY53183.1 clan AA aspartic protease, AF_0612 family [Rivularia sp. PCC 7116]
MINGRISEGKATIPVTFCLPSQPDFSVDFVIDTGFNDYLTLPLQAVNLMNLPLYSSIPARLADGSETVLSVHLATIIWDDVEKVVPVLASGYKPLLGVALMEGYHLEIDFEENGLVSLEKISSSSANRLT